MKVVLDINAEKVVARYHELAASLRKLVDLAEKKCRGGVLCNGGGEPVIARDIRLIAHIIEVTLDRAAHMEAVTATNPAHIVVEPVAVAREERRGIRSHGEKTLHLYVLNCLKSAVICLHTKRCHGGSTRRRLADRHHSGIAKIGFVQ